MKNQSKHRQTEYYKRKTNPFVKTSMFQIFYKTVFLFFHKNVISKS